MEEIVIFLVFVLLFAGGIAFIKFRILKSDLNEKAGTLSDYEFCREVARKLNHNRDIIHVLVYKDELNQLRTNILYDMGFYVKEDKSSVYMYTLMIIERI